MENLPPVPLPIASSTSLIPISPDISADIPQYLNEKIYYLLKIKYPDQNQTELTNTLNSLIIHIIVQNTQQILAYFTNYQEMVRSVFRTSIKNYFIKDVDKINTNLRTKEYKKIYANTWSPFVNYLMKKIKEHHIPITVSSSSSSSSLVIPTLQIQSLTPIDNISIDVDSEATISDHELDDVEFSEPVQKRRKTVRFSDHVFIFDETKNEDKYSGLSILAEVAMNS